MLDLKGKVVVVTGASSGIGAALAQAFSMEGAKVTLTARRLDRQRLCVPDVFAVQKQITR